MTPQQKKQILQRTIRRVRKTLSNEPSGHDWWHVDRVYQHTLRLCRIEGGDPFVAGLAALLHDIADYKFHNGDTEIGPRTAAAWLKKQRVPEETIRHIESIIREMSFKGAKTQSPMKTLEGKIVQDADRLDAIGAIGVARTFAYGGHKGRLPYDPEVPPQPHASFAKYKKSDGPTLNHFHEKLLLLKDRMNTKAARKAAQKRHAFLELFLKTFAEELKG